MTEKLAKVELRLLKELYRRRQETNRRDPLLAQNAFNFLGINKGEDIAALHDSPYFSIVPCDKGNEGFQINAEGIRYIENLPSFWDSSKDFFKKHWLYAALGLIAIIVLLIFGFKLTSIQIGPFGFSPAEQRGYTSNDVREDAKQVADSIVITGWEQPGDYIGYLSQITSFYEKHQDIYPNEYGTYKRQLEEWQNFLDSKRGESLSYSDTYGLMGLVRSGERQMEKIANDDTKAVGH